MTEKIDRVTFRVGMHKGTGLMMALCNELSGLVVHAHSDEELDEKIPAALRSFLIHTQGDDSEWVLIKDAPPGFTPLAYIAERSLRNSRSK
jgi:hypothetical protein